MLNKPINHTKLCQRLESQSKPRFLKIGLKNNAELCMHLGGQISLWRKRFVCLLTFIQMQKHSCLSIEPRGCKRHSSISHKHPQKFSF